MYGHHWNRKKHIYNSNFMFSEISLRKCVTLVPVDLKEIEFDIVLS